MKKFLFLILLFCFCFSAVYAEEQKNYGKILFYKDNIQDVSINKKEKLNEIKNPIVDTEISQINTVICVETDNKSNYAEKYGAFNFHFFDKKKNEINYSPSILRIPEIQKGSVVFPIYIADTFKKLSKDVNLYSIDFVRLYDTDEPNIDYDKFLLQKSSVTISYKTYIILNLKNRLNTSGVALLQFSLLDESLNVLDTVLLEIPMEKNEFKELPIDLNDFDRTIIDNAKYYNIKSIINN